MSCENIELPDEIRRALSIVDSEALVTPYALLLPALACPDPDKLCIALAIHITQAMGLTNSWDKLKRLRQSIGSAYIRMHEDKVYHPSLVRMNVAALMFLTYTHHKYGRLILGSDTEQADVSIFLSSMAAADYLDAGESTAFLLPGGSPGVKHPIYDVYYTEEGWNTRNSLRVQVIVCDSSSPAKVAVSFAYKKPGGTE